MPIFSKSRTPSQSRSLHILKYRTLTNFPSSLLMFSSLPKNRTLVLSYIHRPSWDAQKVFRYGKLRLKEVREHTRNRSRVHVTSPVEWFGVCWYAIETTTIWPLKMSENQVLFGLTFSWTNTSGSVHFRKTQWGSERNWNFARLHKRGISALVRTSSSSSFPK